MTKYEVNPELNCTNSGTELIPSVAVDRIIAQRNEGIALYIASLEQLDAAHRIMRSAAGENRLYGFEQAVYDALMRTEKPERVRAQISRLVDQKIWDRLMNDTGMYTLMSGKQRDEWDRQRDSKDCPEITLDNVLTTFRYLNASKMETFETGIIDVFRSLSWDYKTNNPCKIGKKIIIGHFLDKWGHGGVRIGLNAREKLDDLARPFYLLDGKNVPDCRQSEGAAYCNFFNGEGGVGQVFECEYFTVRSFLKGSAHITMKRPDLVDRLNDIVARHYPAMLPPRV